MVGFRLVSVCTLAVALLSAPRSWSQEAELVRLEARSRGALESYLVAADGSRSDEGWQSVARAGIEGVVAEWEGSAARLADLGIDLPSERERLEVELKGLLDQRYLRWLVDRAFSQEAFGAAGGFIQAVQDANYEHLYQTDEGGILYDAAGDPMLYGAENLSEDRGAWRAAVSAALDSDLAAWGAHAALIRTELLRTLPDGIVISLFDSQFRATEATYRKAYRRELEIAFQREESRFLYQRTLDQFSLRNRSEGKTADSIAAALIAKVDGELKQGLQRLREGLATDRSATPEGAIAIDSAAWQESFRRELDRGLTCFEEAEQELLLERAQWEGSVEEEFQNGELKWCEAFDRLRSQRDRWGAELEAILADGEARWEARSAELAQAIERAQSELARSASTQLESLDSRLGNLGQLAAESASILRTAQSSLDYWTPLLPDPAIRDGSTSAEREWRFWSETQDRYRRYYDESLQGIAEIANDIEGGDRAASYLEGLSLSSSGERSLDAYQIALLTARASEAYWRKEVEIAQAVVDYARDGSSSRPTEASTHEACEEALSLFEEKELSYGRALEALAAAGASIAEGQIPLGGLTAELARIDQELEEAKARYQTVIDLYATRDEVGFRKRLQEYYRELLDLSGLSGNGALSETQAFADWIARTNRLGIETEVSTATGALERLVTGEPTSGLPSLGELRSELESARSWRFDVRWSGEEERVDFLASLSLLGLTDGGDPGRSALRASFAAAYDAYAGAATEMKEGRRVTILAMARQLVSEREDLLDRRVAEIKLITSRSLSAWATEQEVELAPGADSAAAAAAVIAAARSAPARTLLDRARAEQRVLDDLINGNLEPSSGGPVALAAGGDPSALEDPAVTSALLRGLLQSAGSLDGPDLLDEAKRRSKALSEVIDLMTTILSSDDPQLSAHGEEVRSLAGRSPWAAQFLRGTGVFTLDGVDYGAMLLIGPAREGARSSFLASLLDRARQVAPILSRMAEEQAIARTQALLIDRGLATRSGADAVILRRPGEVLRDLLGTGAQPIPEVERWLSDLATELASLESALPRTVAAQLDRAVSALGEALAVAVASGGDPSRSAELGAEAQRLSSLTSVLRADLARFGVGPSRSLAAPDGREVELLSALRSLHALEDAGGLDPSIDRSVSLSAAEVAARFVAQSAATIARRISGGEAGGTSAAEIDAAVGAFLAEGSLRELVEDPTIAPLLPGIRKEVAASVSELLQWAGRLARPEGLDWTSASEALQEAFADSFWNRYSPEWLAGGNDSGGRDRLLAASLPELGALAAIAAELTGCRGPNGIDREAWDTFLTTVYYGGKGTSLVFDRSVLSLERRIAATNGEGRLAYSTLDRSLLTCTELPADALVAYCTAAGAKQALDAVIEGRPYDESGAQASLRRYLEALPERLTDPRRAAVDAFASSYLALFRETGGAVSVEAQSDRWLELLRAELEHATLSRLGSTDTFTGVAAVDLIRIASGGLLDQGRTAYDFSLLKRVLIDCPLSTDEQALVGGIGCYADCAPRLDPYLEALAAESARPSISDALAGDGGDRLFALRLLYAHSYLSALSDSGGAEEGVSLARAHFRSAYLSQGCEELDAALGFAQCLRTPPSDETSSWMVSRLFSTAGAERIAAVRGGALRERAQCDANERLLALGLGSELARLGVPPDRRSGLVSWMLEAAGLAPPENLAVLFGESAGTVSAVSGSAAIAPAGAPSEGGLLLLVASPKLSTWSLKRRALNGEEIETILPFMDESVRTAVAVFQRRLRAATTFVAAAEGSPVVSAAELAGGATFERAVEAAASLALGAWSDPFFALPTGSTAGAIIEARYEIEAARSAVASDYLAEVLSRELSLTQRASRERETALAFAREIDSLRSSGPAALAFRAYLVEPIIGTADEAVNGGSRPLATSVPCGAETPQLVDSPVDPGSGSGGLVVIAPQAGSGWMAGPLWDNALVEAANAYRVESGRLIEAIEAAKTTDRATTLGYFERFERVAAAARPIDVICGWDEAVRASRAIPPSGEIEELARVSEETLERARAAAASLKQEIVLVGTTLAGYLDGGRTSAGAAAASLAERIEGLESERRRCAAEYELALAEVGERVEGYSALYRAVEEGAGELERARCALQKAEAIEFFASTGYLSPPSDGAGGEATRSLDPIAGNQAAVDPDQRLAFLRDRHLRAQAALDALTALYRPDEEPSDFIQGDAPEQSAYRDAFERYQREWGAYLAFERLSGLLSSATAIQQKRVEEARLAVELRVDELLRAVPDPTQLTSAIDLEATYRAQDFVQVVDDDGGLPELAFGSLSTAAQKSDLIAYLTGEGERSYSTGARCTSGYSADRELWVHELSDLLARRPAAELLSGWALALQYQMGPKGLDVAGSSDPKYRALFAGYCVAAAAVEVAGGGGGLLDREHVDFEADFATRAQNAYERIMGDSTERRLYEFFVATTLLGLTGDGNISAAVLEAEYRAEAQQYLVDRLSPKADSYRRSADGFFVAAAVASLFPWTWGFAAALYAAGFDYKGRAEAIGAYIDSDLAGAITGAKAKAAGNAQTIAGKTTGSGGYLALMVELRREEEVLAGIEGVASGGACDADQLRESILIAARVRHGAAATQELAQILAIANSAQSAQTDPMDLDELLRRRFTTGPAERDPASALEGMLVRSRSSRDEALAAMEKVAGELENLQVANVARYQEAVDRLAGSAGSQIAAVRSDCGTQVSEVRDSARVAFIEPLFRAQDHLHRLFAFHQRLLSALDSGRYPELQQAQSDLLAAQQQGLASLLDNRLDAERTVRAASWSQRQLELQNQELVWRASVEAIRTRAYAQWAAALATVAERHDQWVAAFKSAYQERVATWNAGYTQICASRNDWVQEAAQVAAGAASTAILDQLRQSAVGRVRMARSLGVCDLGLSSPDPEGAVAALLRGSDFASLLEGGRILEGGISHANAELIARIEPSRFESSAVLHRLAEMEELTSEEVAKHVLVITASEARRVVAAAAGRMNEQIAEANRGVAQGLRDTLTSAGFVEAGAGFERNTVVGSTISGPIRELHRVPAFTPYHPTEAIAPRVDLSDALLCTLSARGIQAQVENAVGDMREQLDAIFGEAAAKGTERVTIWEWVESSETCPERVTLSSERSLARRTVSVTKTERRRTGRQTDQEIGGGAFGRWIGAAPEMDDRPDAEAASCEVARFLRRSGSGQLAVVLTPYLWSQLRESAGWAQVGLPLYDQKFWNDRDTFVKAPTLRSVADVGAGVLGTLLGGGVGGMLVGLAEKGLFAAADIGSGRVSWDEGLVGLGKSLLAGAVGFGSGALGAAMDQAMRGLSTAGAAIAGAAAVGATRVVDSLGAGLVNAITYASGVGFGLDDRRLAEAVVGRGALSGYLGTMAGRAGSVLLSGELGGFGTVDSERVLSVATLGGSVADLATQYAVTGSAAMNVLQLSDLGGRPGLDAGLLELHVGAGASLNLGMGGTAVGLGVIARAAEGFDAFAAQQQIRLYNALGGVEYAEGYRGCRDVTTALRASYSFGDAAARLQLDRFLGGLDRLRVGFAADASGQTTVAERIRTVDLATLGLPGDLTSQMMAGIVLQHEAYRNGVGDGWLGQTAETAAAVLGHAEMAERIGTDPQYQECALRMRSLSPRLSQDLAALSDATRGAGIGSFARYAATAYDSSGDYWRMMNDGRLAYDGSGWLVDQAGSYVLDAQGDRIGAEGVETGLLAILGEQTLAGGSYSDDQRARVQKLMVASGLLGSEGTVASTMWAGVHRAALPSMMPGAIDLTEINRGKTLDMDRVMAGWGSTVATEVFLNTYYQSASHAAIAGLQPSDLLGSAVAREMGSDPVISPFVERLCDLLSTMTGYYGGPHLLFDRDAVAGLQSTQGYGPSDLKIAGKAVYQDSQHKGIDIAGPEGTPEYSLLGGRVSLSGYRPQVGNTVIVDLGFAFEGKFEPIGVASQFMHMQKLPAVYAGQMVSGDTLLGYMGQTGVATGPHLHFQLMGAYGGITPTATQWEVYQPRRDVLLSYLGAPISSDYTKLTTSKLNFWAGTYSNFYYNANAVADRLQVNRGGK